MVLKNFIIIIVICFSYLNAEQKFHNVEFGFNIGYLGETKKYNVALLQIQRDGFKDVRVYEPFTKGLCANPGKIINYLNYLTKNFHVLLSISNLPYTKLMNNKFKQKYYKMNNYTNRYFDKNNIILTENYLKLFKELLIQTHIYSKIDIEIWNEPDAENYFWNRNSNDFKSLKYITENIFNEKKLLCCGFTSNKDIIESIAKQAEFGFDKNNTLSFHLYSLDHGFIKPSKSGAIITEYNLYSYYTKNTTQKNVDFGKKFHLEIIKLLQYAQKYNINKIYLFKLMDNDSNIGRLGFFDINGKEKKQYVFLKQITKFIKHGYAVSETEHQYIIRNSLNETMVFEKK
jgi:hypothetical protein